MLFIRSSLHVHQKFKKNPISMQYSLSHSLILSSHESHTKVDDFVLFDARSFREFANVFSELVGGIYLPDVELVFSDSVELKLAIASLNVNLNFILRLNVVLA